LKAIQLESSNDIFRIIQDTICNDIALLMRSLILMPILELRLRLQFIAFNCIF